MSVTEADLVDLRCQTFHRPWSEAIIRPRPALARVSTPKNVENRPKPPARGQVGRFMGVYTGKKIDLVGLRMLTTGLGYDWGVDDLSPPGFILGLVRVMGVIPAKTSPAVEPWYFGATDRYGNPNVGWRLGEVVRFAEPVPCKPRCAQGWWRVPPEALDAVRAQCGPILPSLPRPAPAPSPQGRLFSL